VGLLLPVASRLRSGDVVYADDRLIIHIRVLPAEVLVIPVRTMEELASIAYELGSLHCPVQFTPTEIIIPADDPMEALLRRRGIRFELEVREFQPMEAVEGMKVGVDSGEGFFQGRAVLSPESGTKGSGKTGLGTARL
jgi:urease accessory protein UreE